MKVLKIAMLCMFCAVYSQAQNVTQADIDAQQQVITNAADDITKINKQIAAILRQTAEKNRSEERRVGKEC